MGPTDLLTMPLSQDTLAYYDPADFATGVLDWVEKGRSIIYIYMYRYRYV